MPFTKLHRRKSKQQKENKQIRGLIGFIIYKRKLIEKLFGCLVILSILCVPFVGVNYDLSKYLPTSAVSKQGLDLMEQEFGYPGTARIMIGGDLSIYEAKAYKDRIEAVPGVDMVLWTDTVSDVYQANQFIRYKEIEDYYKDGYAVMDITFIESDSSAKTHKAIDKIMEITGDKGYFTGSAVQNKSLSETLTKQIAIAMVMGVIMIAIILCLTTTSWFEPFLFLMIMGIAIVINMGTNLFLDTISFLTFSVASILQLAIAMDYSIFLLHSFTREKAKGLEPEVALAHAIKGSVSSILSSGATTIVGFIVLTLMQFTIGKDLGIVLAKGIVISLFTVLFLMPALILRFSGKIDKTAHRSFLPSFDKMGKGIYRIRYGILIVVAVLILPAYVAQGMNAFQYGNDALGSSPGTKVYEDEQAINARFGRSNLMLALVPRTSNVTEKQLTREIENLYYIKSVTSLAGTLPEGIPESFLPETVTGMLHTEHYSRIMIFAKTANESEFAFSCSEQIEQIVHQYYPEDSYVVGVTPSTIDIRNVITKDYSFVNILSLVGVALVIMFTFKSGIIPIVVMIPIEVAIFFNMALPYLFGAQMIFMGYIIVSCLQLGATVDYSILLTNNYLNARKTLEKRQAAEHAISASALSILTSGSILTIVGYGLYFTSTVAAIADIGRLVGRGALLSLILVLCLLPSLLTLCDKMIFDQKERLERLGEFNKTIHTKNKKALKLMHLKRQRRLRNRQRGMQNRLSHPRAGSCSSIHHSSKSIPRGKQGKGRRKPPKGGGTPPMNG